MTRGETPEQPEQAGGIRNFRRRGTVQAFQVGQNVAVTVLGGPGGTTPVGQMIVRRGDYWVFEGDSIKVVPQAEFEREWEPAFAEVTSIADAAAARRGVTVWMDAEPGAIDWFAGLRPDALPN